MTVATLQPGNIQIVTDPDDHIGAFHATGQWYEPDLLDDMRTVATPGAVAVDAGCHVGNHTLWLAAICDLQVVAIDPNPVVVNQLELSAWLNDLQTRISVVPVAVADEPGRGRLVRNNPGNTGDTTIQLTDDEDAVPIVTIDSLAVPSPVVIVKVDVQGWEAAALVGAVGLLERDRPVVYVEDNDPPAIAAALEPLGYVKGARFCVTPTFRWDPT